MKRPVLRPALLMPLMLAGCGAPASAPAPHPSAPGADYRAMEARNYINLFATNDTQQWELAK